jgi:hypothetical protein
VGVGFFGALAFLGAPHSGHYIGSSGIAGREKVRVPVQDFVQAFFRTLYSLKVLIGTRRFRAVPTRRNLIVRVELKKSMIEHTYVKVDNFWLPAGSRTETAVRLSGLAVLSIEYRDYKITGANPSTALDSRVVAKPVLGQLGVSDKP